MGILPKILPRTEAPKQAAMERDLMRFESNIGRNIFGPIPKDHNRDFFCLDEYTWIWHEDWLDKRGKRVVVSTSYSIRQNSILKSQNGHPYRMVDKTEASHLYHAAKQYIRLVKQEYTRLLQQAA